MELPDFSEVLNNKVLISALSLTGGALLGNFVSVYRNRVKVIEYTVAHDRIGVSADDAIFGTVRVTWQGQDVTNLYSSVVTVENTTSVDYTNVKLKVYTGNTVLLNERMEISGTTYIPKWTDDFSNLLRVPEGSIPTDFQFNVYRHSREYLVPVLNRGQRVVLHYLTTVPNSNETPSVWLDTLHPSAQVSFRPVTQQIHGVPLKLALPLGLIACLAVLVAVSLLLDQSWAAAAIAMAVGLVAQSIGAWIYRGFRFVRRIVLR